MQSPDPIIRLSEYQVPAWRISRVQLEFDLDAQNTKVTSTLVLNATEPEAHEPLRLDGEALELLEIGLDGRPLESHEYMLDESGLTIPNAPAECELRTVVRIHPHTNTRLEGVYQSRGALFTQCEAEGFRRITYFVDRPDVSAVFDVVLRADRSKYPVLLSNGNLIDEGELEGNLHFTRWHDPHPKPCYLFALVAGKLARVSAPFTTMEGLDVEVNIWADPVDVARCEYALGAVLRSMAWDEQRFGRAYDLSVFNVVAAQDFTMGAMENKGLNIFNARYILADNETATDDDFLAIESVIGHEYFHNWSGNRVTLRDWFQLSLKEGLTVFRDQEFTSDLHSRGLKRIEDVRLLKSRQYVEDAGPLSHPVRPSSYSEINNFYTATVYEKGAELIRMLHTLLGETDFRKGLDDYFATHDGGAATIEDLLAAMTRASGRQLSQFLRWWEVPGTPVISVEDSFDPDRGEYLLLIRQQVAQGAMPLHIPLSFAFYGSDGKRLTQKPYFDGQMREGLVELTNQEHMLRLEWLNEQPLPAFLQGLSAPVRLEFSYTPAQLARLVQLESDPLTRWDAIQQLVRMAILPGDKQTKARRALLQAQADLLADDNADPAFVAECLTLPDIWDISSNQARIDIDALWEMRERVLSLFAHEQKDALVARYEALAEASQQGLDGASAGARSLRHVCLKYLARVEKQGDRAVAHYDNATTLTERMAAMATLVHSGLPQADVVLADFARKYRGNTLLVDKWLSLVVSAPRLSITETVKTLIGSPYWQTTNPNRVRAILGTFARNNSVAFHRIDGEGYRIFFEQLPVLDAINPQVAARHLGILENWYRLDDVRRDQLAKHMDALAEKLASRDSREVLTRLRNACAG